MLFPFLHEGRRGCLDLHVYNILLVSVFLHEDDVSIFLVIFSKFIYFDLLYAAVFLCCLLQ